MVSPSFLLKGILRASDVDQGLHAGNDKEEANRILDAGRDLDVSSNEAEITGGQDNLNHVIEPATEENMEKETTEGLTEMGNGSEHVKEDIPADFESRRREIQSVVSEHIEEYDSSEEYESDVKVIGSGSENKEPKIYINSKDQNGQVSEKVHKNCYDFVGELEAADNQGDDMNLQFTIKYGG
ncbi:uncharacterized protein LOC108952606 [Musa acuminata AAA Group]|uniref:uncharacterized protein LOC108952606 n=1 Tax=Musa acuminata AAA Group TaxID=214697 RepID=UPI0031CF4327